MDGSMFASELREKIYNALHADVSLVSGSSEPRMIFHLDRDADDFSLGTLELFLSELKLLSGVGIVPTKITDGCLIVEVSAGEGVDEAGESFRKLFYQDDRYIEFCEEYDVIDLYFHHFRDGQNWGHHYSTRYGLLRASK